MIWCKNFVYSTIIKKQCKIGLTSLLRLHIKRPLIYNCFIRYYLSSLYKLEDKWKQRLEDPFVKGTKPVEFYYDLIRKYRKDGKIAAIDADLFFNSIDDHATSSLSEEIEEVLRLLRRSPETIHTLESTTHAAVRLLMTSENNTLMKLISDTTNYGIFLEPYLANLLMDKFLMEKNYTAACRVAASLMLQEDFGPPLTKSLVLLSGFQFAFNIGNNEEWVDYISVPEPAEEVKVVVRYVTNPYFDDHFDLREPLLIVGKTLAWLSPLIEEPFKTNAEILGWSLFNKWNFLEASLTNLLTTKQLLDEQVHLIVATQIEKCEDNDIQSKLVSLLSSLRNRKDIVKNLNIIEQIEQFVKEQCNKHEKEDIAAQTEVYNNFVIKRKDAIDKQLEMYEKRKLIAEIEEKKKYLKEKEEVIFFFDNKDKIELELFKKKQLYPQHELEKEKAKTADEVYISPEVKRRHN